MNNILEMARFEPTSELTMYTKCFPEISEFAGSGKR
jgi:hypothetical protein